MTHFIYAIALLFHFSVELKGERERERENRGEGRSLQGSLKDGVKDTNAGKESVCLVFWN